MVFSLFFSRFFLENSFRISNFSKLLVFLTSRSFQVFRSRRRSPFSQKLFCFQITIISKFSSLLSIFYQFFARWSKRKWKIEWDRRSPFPLNNVPQKKTQKQLQRTQTRENISSSLFLFFPLFFSKKTRNFFTPFFSLCKDSFRNSL